MVSYHPHVSDMTSPMAAFAGSSMYCGTQNLLVLFDVVLQPFTPTCSNTNPNIPGQIYDCFPLFYNASAANSLASKDNCCVSVGWFVCAATQFN